MIPKSKQIVPVNWDFLIEHEVYQKIMCKKDSQNIEKLGLKCPFVTFIILPNIFVNKDKNIHFSKSTFKILEFASKITAVQYQYSYF